MHHFRTIRRVALGAAVAGAVIGLVPAAASANQQPTCTYNDGLRQVNVADKSDIFNLQLFVLLRRRDRRPQRDRLQHHRGPLLQPHRLGHEGHRVEHRPDRRVRHARGDWVRRLPRRLLDPGFG